MYLGQVSILKNLAIARREQITGKLRCPDLANANKTQQNTPKQEFDRSIDDERRMVFFSHSC